MKGKTQIEKQQEKEKRPEQMAQKEPPKEAVPIAPPPAPPHIEAKEDEIVISPTPKVTPEVPKPKAPSPSVPKYVTHKIRWGDTLWDLSQTYYRTPWKYKKIASYNKIRNPDLIISGETLKIPSD